MIVKAIERKDIKETKKPFKSRLVPYLFLLPHLIFFLVFVVYPFFYGIVMSFFKYDLMTTPQWVGFQNYADILTPGTVFNKDFWGGIGHTAFFTVIMVPLIIIVPLILAVLLFSIKNNVVRSVFQAILYASSVLSVATVVMTFKWLLDRENGFINNFFQVDINWRGKQPMAWISIFILTLWAGVGGNMIIFLSAISSIPKSQYEAARLDGASPIKQFFRLTLPSLKFPLLYAIVTGTIGAFNVFGQPYLFGGPNGTYETIMMKIQQYAFGSSTPMAGMASAMSVLLGLMIIAVSLVQFRLLKTKE